MNNIPRIAEIFIKLCSIGSPSGQEDTVAHYVKNFLKNKVDMIFEDKSGNVYARINGSGSKKPLLLAAHMDTVEPAGNQRPVIKNGVIYSNGKVVLGADNKVAVALLLNYIEKQALEKKVTRTLEFIFSVREETEGAIRHFPKNKIKAKECIMFDNGMPVGYLMTKAPYVCGYGIRSKSPGGHVKLLSKKTIHPLKFLNEFVEKMPIGQRNNDTIVNIAKIQMGENYNSIPLNLYFTGEIRTFNKKTYQKFIKDLKVVIIKLDKKLKTRTKLELFPYCDGYTLGSDDIKFLKEIFVHHKVNFQATSSFAVGDFNIVSSWGIKTFNLGDGACLIHTPQEYMAIKDLLLLEKLLEDIVAQ